MLVARTVVRPLRRVGSVVERMGSGELSARATEDGPEEVTALASTVNAMADRIQRDSAGSAEARAIRDLILTSMREGVALYGTDGEVAFANPAVEAHLGGPPSSAGILAPEVLRDTVRAAMDGRQAEASFDLGVPARWLEALAVPVEGGGVLLVLRDVTQERRLDAVRRDFVANASHELKTPAATIQAAAETIRIAAEDDPEAVPRFAERLETEALRMSRIVADLLDLSRLESGGESLTVVELGAVVDEEAERFRAEASEAGVTMTVGTEPQRVDGSSKDLGLLVRNLLSNAIRYTQEGGSISVALERDGEWAELRVSDTGIGIPGRDQDRIFERFYRVDRARSRETGGTGLGLAIVRHVAENHGGTVAVESELGAGSTFTVRLPLSSRP
jgi:signal transduction histidine kinase